MKKREWTDLIVDSGARSGSQVEPPTGPSPMEPETESTKTEGVESTDSGRLRGLWITVALVALLLGAVLTYFVYDLSRQQSLQRQAFQTFTEEMSQTLQVIEKRLDDDADRIADLGSQIEVTMQRVGVTQRELARARSLAEQLKKEQEENVAAFTREIQQKASATEVAELEQQSSQKFDGVNQEISEVKDNVQSTRQDLLQTMSQLSDLGVKVNEQGQMIATNLKGVEELRRRGERDYVTFELEKKILKRVAGISLELLDTDGSPRDADIRIHANDTEIEHKDVSQNVPVNLYVGAKRIPYELVFNEISNKPDRVKGYISLPKGELREGPPKL